MNVDVQFAQPKYIEQHLHRNVEVTSHGNRAYSQDFDRGLPLGDAPQIVKSVFLSSL